MPYSDDGGTWWNVAACFPIVPDPASFGDPCQWTGDVWSGYDNCDWGQICWTFEGHFEPIETGTCIGLCLLDASDPSDSYYCEDPAASPSIGCQDCPCVCQTPCDPLIQECEDGMECIPSDYDFFECWPDASGDTGAYGDPCPEYVLNVCDPGLVCMEAAAVPGCEGSTNCCTNFCDINQPNTCPGAAEGQECVPWYEPPYVPTGSEHVGVCALPQ